MHAHLAPAVSREDVLKRIVAAVIAVALAFVVGFVPGWTDANWLGIAAIAAIVGLLIRRLDVFDYLLAAFAAVILLLPMFIPGGSDDYHGMAAWGVICGVMAAQIVHLLFMRRHEGSHQ